MTEACSSDFRGEQTARSLSSVTRLSHDRLEQERGIRRAAWSEVSEDQPATRGIAPVIIARR